MRQSTKRYERLLILLITSAVFLIPGVALGQGSVVNVADAKAKRHEKSGAVVKFLATPNLHNTKSAFFAHLTIKAKGQVPEHQDTSDEYLYILSGKGRIWIDNESYHVKPGSLIYLPAMAKVKFKADDKQDVLILQVFVPPGPELKYNVWADVDSEANQAEMK